MTPDKSDFDDIDPTVFIDDDGQAYLYWGNGKCKYVKLGKDMVSIEGPVHYVEVPKFGEALWLHKYNGLYYLSYSSGLPPTIEYCTSEYPVGSWTYRGKILNTVKNCPISHQAVTTHKNHWYLIYNNGAMPGGNGFRRSVCMEEFHYQGDGIIPLVKQTSRRNLQVVGHFDPNQMIYAVTMPYAEVMVVTSRSPRAVAITTKFGSYLKVSHAGFGKNRARKLELCFDVSLSKNNYIELYLDSLQGTVVAAYRPGESKSLNFTVTTKTKKILGIRDVFLRWLTDREKTSSLKWWKFQKYFISI